MPNDTSEVVCTCSSDVVIDGKICHYEDCDIIQELIWLEFADD